MNIKYNEPQITFVVAGLLMRKPEFFSPTFKGTPHRSILTPLATFLGYKNHDKPQSLRSMLLAAFKDPVPEDEKWQYEWHRVYEKLSGKKWTLIQKKVLLRPGRKHVVQKDDDALGAQIRRILREELHTERAKL